MEKQEQEVFALRNILDKTKKDTSDNEDFEKKECNKLQKPQRKL